VRKMRGEAEFDPREWEPPEDPRHNLITDCGGGASKVRVATLFVLATLLATVTPSIWVGPAGLEPATHGLKVRTFGMIETWRIVGNRIIPPFLTLPVAPCPAWAWLQLWLQ